MRNDRLWLIDIYRTLSIIPIITLHMYEVLFSSNQTLVNHTGTLNYLFEIFVRSFSFSGYIIVFIFFFLHGFRLKQLLLKKILLILFGLITLSVLIGSAWYNNILIEWDIYHYLALSLFLIYLIKNHLKGSPIELVGLFILSIIPYEKVFPLSAGPLQNIIYGNCSLNESMWPVLPYVFFALFAFDLGKFSRKHPLSSPTPSYLLLSLGFSSIAFTSFYYFFDIPPGPAFGCYTHKLPFIYWIPLLLGISSIFYASSSSAFKLNSRNTVINSLSSLKWNSNFGVSYIVQWLVLALAAMGESFILNFPTYFYLFPLIVFLCTELIVQGVSKLWPS